MIRSILLLLVIFATSDIYAARLVVQDPCAQTPWLEVVVENASNQTVGQVSVSALESSSLPFTGSERGILSINDSVSGEQALEVVSPVEMKAYGWCFSVNQRVPDAFPHEVLLESSEDVVYWFFAYAHYKDGDWISMCTPVHQELPRYICG